MKKRINNPLKQDTLMKKTAIILLLFLFTSVVISYARVTDDDPSDNAASSYTGSISYTDETTTDSYTDGLFKNSDADLPGGRPDNGGGIGQSTPISDGLFLLIGCCIVLAVAKTVNEKRKSSDATVK